MYTESKQPTKLAKPKQIEAIEQSTRFRICLNVEDFPNNSNMKMTVFEDIISKQIVFFSFQLKEIKC